MKRKITINKSDNRAINGRLNIPIKLLKEMGINEKDREVIINLDGNKLIIEKVCNNNINLVDKICLEVSQDERDFLLGKIEVMDWN